MEWQVSNKELSKRLKELGVKQESLWWWEEWILRAHTPYKSYVVRNKRFFEDHNGIIELPPKVRIEYVSAFTVAELGEMLPSYIKPDVQGYEIERIKTERNGGHYRCYYRNIERVGKNIITKIVEFAEATEANARAKMVIYLREKSKC